MILGTIIAFGTIVYTQKMKIDELEKNKANNENSSLNSSENKLSDKNSKIMQIEQLLINGLKNRFLESLELLKKIRHNIEVFFNKHDFESKSIVIDNTILKIRNYVNELSNLKNSDDLKELSKFEEFNKNTFILFGELIDNLNKKNNVENNIKLHSENIESNNSNQNLNNFKVDLKTLENNPNYLKEKIDELKNILNINDKDFENILLKIKNNSEQSNKYSELIFEIFNLLKNEHKQYYDYASGYLEKINDINTTTENSTKEFFKNYPINFVIDDKKIDIIDYKNEKDSEKKIVLKLEKSTSIDAFKINFSHQDISSLKIFTSNDNENYNEIYSTDTIDKNNNLINLANTIQNVSFIRLNLNVKKENLNILSINSFHVLKKANISQELNFQDKLINNFWQYATQLTKKHDYSTININELNDEQKNSNITNLIFEISSLNENIYKVREIKNRIDSEYIKTAINLLKNDIKGLETKIKDKNLKLESKEASIEKLLQSVASTEKELQEKDKELEKLININNNNTQLLSDKVKSFAFINNQLLETKKALKNSESIILNLSNISEEKDKKIKSLEGEVKTVNDEKNKLKDKINNAYFLSNKFVLINKTINSVHFKEYDIHKINFHRNTQQYHIMDYDMSSSSIKLHFYDYITKKLKNITINKSSKEEQVKIIERDYAEDSVIVIEEKDDSYEEYYGHYIHEYTQEIGKVFFKIIRTSFSVKDGKIYLNMTYDITSDLIFSPNENVFLSDSIDINPGLLLLGYEPI